MLGHLAATDWAPTLQAVLNEVTDSQNRCWTKPRSPRWCRKLLHLWNRLCGGTSGWCR